MTNQAFLLTGIFLIAFSTQKHKISKNCSDSIEVFSEDYACVRGSGSFISEGSNGIAFLVKKKDTNTEYVFKVSEENKKAKVEALSRINIELEPVDITEKLQGGKYIIKRFSKIKKNGNIYEILEYGAKGSLKGYARKLSLEKDQRLILTLFMKIVDGVAFMHDKNIVHADLKPDNIIVNQVDDPKIIDFDLSVDMHELKACRGTLEFMDPDMIKNCRVYIKYSDRQDIWSLGVTLYAILYGIDPYFLEHPELDPDDSKIEFKHISPKLVEFYKAQKIFLKKGTSIEIIDIMLLFLKTNPWERQTLGASLKAIEDALKVKSWVYTTEDQYISIANKNFSPVRANHDRLINESDSILSKYLFLLMICVCVIVTAAIYDWIWKRKVVLED